MNGFTHWMEVSRQQYFEEYKHNSDGLPFKFDYKLDFLFPYDKNENRLYTNNALHSFYYVWSWLNMNLNKVESISMDELDLFIWVWPGYHVPKIIRATFWPLFNCPYALLKLVPIPVNNENVPLISRSKSSSNSVQKIFS